MAALKAADSYLHAARFVPSWLFTLACERVSETWRSDEHYNAPAPADILGAVRVIRAQQKADQQCGHFKRRMDEARANRLTPVDAAKLLVECDPESHPGEFWDQRRAWLRQFAGAV